MFKSGNLLHTNSGRFGVTFLKISSAVWLKCVISQNQRLYVRQRMTRWLRLSHKKMRLLKIPKVDAIFIRPPPLPDAWQRGQDIEQNLESIYMLS